MQRGLRSCLVDFRLEDRLHFGGHFQGRDLRDKYPKGSDPYVLGEACNTAFTYGYDSVTQMQETKASLCKISAA